MRYNDLIANLRKKEIASVYLFSGEETYLKEEVIEKISEILLNSENKDFNYDLIYADESNAQEIIYKAASLPFLSDKRLVIVKRADKLEQVEQKKLIAFLQKPVATTCLIFVTTGKVNLKTAFYANLGEVGESVVFWPLFDNQVPVWVKSKIKEKNKTITEDAVAYLQEAVGNELMKLSSQIEKLVIYSGANNKITLAEVKEVIADIKSVDIYKMIDAISEKNKAISLKILSKLIQEGEEPVKLLWNIAFRFRNFLKAQILLERKVAPKDVTSQLGINNFLDKNFIKQTNNFSKYKIIEEFKNILKADISLKTGTDDPQLILELLVLRLCE